MQHFSIACLTFAAVLKAAASPPTPDSFELTGHMGWVTFIGFSADSKVLTTVDEHGFVQRWEARTGKLISSRSDGPLPLEHPRREPKEVWPSFPARSFTPDGSAVAWLTGKGTARVRDLTIGKEAEFRPDDRLEFRGVALSPDGAILATAAAKGKGEGFDQLRFWDAKTGKLLRTADEPKPVHGMPVVVPIRMEFAPDGKTLVTTEVAIRCWDVATGRYRARLASVFGHTLSFSPDGKRVVVGSVAPSIEGVGYYTDVIDTVTADHVTSLGVRAQRTMAGWFLPGGRLVASLGIPDDPNVTTPFVQLYEVGSWKATKRLDGWFVAASPNGKVVLTLVPDRGGGRVLAAWDASSGSELRRLPSGWVPWAADLPPEAGLMLPNPPVVFSPDGTRMVIAEIRNAVTDKARMIIRLVPTAGLWTLPGSDAPAVVPALRLRGEGDAPNKGEALLREMDATIAAAKTLRIEFAIRDASVAKGDLVAKGSLVLGDRNRFRHVFESFWLVPTRSVSVSDGKQIGGVPPHKNAPSFPPLPDWYNEVLRSWLGRGGAFASPAVVVEYAGRAGGKKPGPEDEPRVSNAKLLSDQEVGRVKAWVIAYDLTWRALGPNPEDQAVKVQVWIDPKTGLPVRRAMTSRKQGREVRIRRSSRSLRLTRSLTPRCSWSRTRPRCLVQWLRPHRSTQVAYILVFTMA